MLERKSNHQQDQMKLSALILRTFRYPRRMCGRFTLTQSVEVLAKQFQLDQVPPLEPQYNIAPTESVATILVADQKRQLRMLRWGLIPSWAKDPKIGSRLINARAETLSEKPSFRSAFKYRRCLVLADGFYEWQQLGGKKQPHYIHQDGQIIAFAGLWEHWQGQDGNSIDSCTILTTAANERLQPIHHRMPVILDPQAYDRWLDPTIHSAEALQPLLHPAALSLTVTPVSRRVNNPAFNDPECIAPANPA